MTRVPVTKATLVDPLASATPKRQSLKKAVHPSSKHKNDDEYTRFETSSKARQKLVLTQGMEAYLNDKFTHYVEDKAIQESVLDLIHSQG